MSRRKGQSPMPIEERLRVVLAVLSGELSVAEAARRHGTTPQTVSTWRDRFLEAGKAGLDNMMPGPNGKLGSSTERRLPLEAEQLKLALAEATVQLRIWQKGAGYVDQVPSSPSRP